MAAVRIGIVGIGNMGLAMALRLRDRGHAVRVRDIDPGRERLAAAAGCMPAPSAAALAGHCELVIVAVVDAEQTRAVLFGAEGAADALRLRPAGVMLCPTISPTDVEDCCRQLAARGVACVDAPMSGGPARARAGRMSLMVACDDAVFDRWHAVLDDLADPVFRVGTAPGDGARTKLVNNLLAAVNLMGAAEALALAARLGLDPGRTLDVIERSSGQSWIGSDRLRRALAGRDEPLAHMTLLAKDSALAVAAARAAAFATPMGDRAAEGFARALAAGLAQHDDSLLLRWLQAQVSTGLAD